MIAHTGLAVRNFTAAKKFYERALAPLGYTAKMQFGEATGFNDGKNTDFWIGKSERVEPTHVAFEAKSNDEVQAIYGRVNVVRERALIERLWKDSWKIWFPRGPSDSAIALLRFDADRGELWNDLGLLGVQYSLALRCSRSTSAQPMPAASTRSNVNTSNDKSAVRAPAAIVATARAAARDSAT